MDFVRILIGMAAGMLLAMLISKVLQHYLILPVRPGDFVWIRHGKRIKLPKPTDYASLTRRLEMLSQIAPIMAIIDGWQIIEATILARARKPRRTEASSRELIDIVQTFPGVSTSTVDRLKQISEVHNYVAYDVGPKPERKDMEAVVQEMVPFMAEIDPRFQQHMSGRETATSL